MNYAMYFSELYSTGCSSNCEPHDIRYQPKRQPKYGGSRIGSQVEHCHSTRTPAQATQSSNGKGNVQTFTSGPPCIYTSTFDFDVVLELR